ncbi:unnamed protein product [Tuber aestivum]|uniref:Extracellular membrane protein CFEM domain-containing protein n=1 Tax=Tuber aestivum TaxID=59557 RepID=A0A292PTW3_9PEZI|nr:unnamed protein product [Tuber aestivum]
MFTRRCWTHILFSLSIPLFASAAEIGYGPLFDPCGDNCQTQMVQFCTVGHDLAQMTDCWCGEDAGEYVRRMDACLSTCDQAVSNRSVQRDQMVRYRKIVCEGQRGKTAVADTLFAEYWKTRFRRKGENFVPAVTNNIPPPTAEPVGITRSDDRVSESKSISPPTSIPETSSVSSETRSPVSPSPTPPPVTSTPAASPPLSSSLITPTTSPGLTSTRISPAPPVASSIPSKSRLTAGQLAAIITSAVLGSLLVVLSVVFCHRRRANSKPFSFLPTRPRSRPRPRVTTTQQSWWSRNIEAALNNPQSPISTILPRHYRPKPQTPPYAQPSFPPPRQTYSHTIIPVPPSPSSRSSSTRILALSTATRSRSRDRISEHTVIEPQPQEALAELSGTRMSAASSQTDISSASCSSMMIQGGGRDYLPFQPWPFFLLSHWAVFFCFFFGLE